MTRQAEVFPVGRPYLGVRIVARRTLEAVGAANLVGMGDLLQVTLVGMTAIAGLRLIDVHGWPGLGMRIVAVRTRHTSGVMRRSVPTVDVPIVMALQAKVLSRLRE